METGQRVGEYILGEKLGEGGFGEVWKAYADGATVPVALKIATRPESVSALRKEGIVRHAVKHPFIVPIREVREDAKPPFLVMEFVAGPSLRAVLDKEKRLSPENATKVVGYVKRLIAPPLVAPAARAVRRELTLLSTLSGHTSPIRHGVLHPKGDLLATAGVDGQVNVWHLGAEKLLSILEARIPDLRTLAINAEGDALAAGSEDGTVYVWSVSGREIARLRGGPGPVHATAFSPDGKRLVALSDVQHVWTMPQGEPLGDGVFCADPPTCATFSPDGRMLAIGARNGGVRVWQMPKGNLLAHLRAHLGPVMSIAFRPDGRALATAGQDDHVLLWRVPEGTAIGKPIEHGGHVVRVSFSPDGRVFALDRFDVLVD